MALAYNTSRILNPFKKFNVYWVKKCPKFAQNWFITDLKGLKLSQAFSRNSSFFYRLFKNQRKKGINDFFCKTNVEAIVVIDVHNISSHFEALKKTFKFGLFWQSFATLISHLGVTVVFIQEVTDWLHHEFQYGSVCNYLVK